MSMLSSLSLRFILTISHSLDTIIYHHPMLSFDLNLSLLTEDDGMTFGGSLLDAPMSMEAATEEKRRRRLTEAKDDLAFPDEMDTPGDVSARLRFARYRALQSFRSSPWHPKENLPLEYSRIFQFEDFGGTQRR